MRAQYKLGMLTSYIGFVISTLAGFILPPMIIAHLGKELNGLYNALTSFSIYFGMMDLGLGTAIIRYVAKYRAEGNDGIISKYMYVMRNVYLVICSITLLIGTVFTFFVPYFFNASIPLGYNEKAKAVFFFSLLSIVLTIFDNLYYSTIKAYEQFFVSRSTAIARVIIRVTIIIILLENNYSIVAISFTDFLATLLIMIFRMQYAKKKLSLRYHKPKKGEIDIKQIFSYSSYILIYSLTEKVFWELDKVVLGIMAGGISVTIYTIGSQISSSISSVSSTVTSMYLPHAVKTSSNKDNYTQIMAQMARYQLFVIIPVFLGFVFFGKNFLMLWVGEGYDESYKIAIVLIATFVPVLLQSYGEALLKALNIQKVYASAMIVSVLINVILTIILIPVLGSFGAALASSIVNIFRCFFMAVYYQKRLNIQIIEFVSISFKGITISIITLIVTGLLLLRYTALTGWAGLILRLFIFVLVYLISLICFVFNEHERSILHSIKKKILFRGTNR